MLGCNCVLLSCLLSVTLFHCSAESLLLTEEKPEYVEPAQHGPVVQKASGSVNTKLLLLDQLLRLENEVIETKKKRSFSSSNAPIDRLSISTMDPKNNKQRKVVELPRRKVSIPIDRIGMGRLPNSRG